MHVVPQLPMAPTTAGKALRGSARPPEKAADRRHEKKGGSRRDPGQTIISNAVQNE